MQVESVRDNAVAQAKIHAEAEKKEVGILYLLWLEITLKIVFKNIEGSCGSF